MQETIKKFKLPLIIIAVLLVGFVMYNTFLKKPVSTTLLKQSSTATSSPEQNFLPILIQIQGVTFDEKLFLDPIFRALIDFSQPIVPENVGKQNPFSGILLGAVNSSVESLGFTESGTSVQTPAVKKTTR